MARKITEHKRSEAQFLSYERKLLALHEHAALLDKTRDLDEIVQHTLDAMGNILSFDTIDVFMIDDGCLCRRGSRGRPVSFPKIPLTGPGVTVKAANTKRTMRIADTRKEEAYVGRDGRIGKETAQRNLSELAVPVIIDDSVVAVLNAENERPNAFSGVDQQLLEVVALRFASDLKRLQNETKLRKSHEQYKTLLEASRDGIAVSVGMKWVYVNQRYAEQMGFSDPSELLGRDLLESIVPEYREMVKNRIIKAMAGEDVPPLYETMILRKDGTRVPVEINSTSIDFYGEKALLAFRRDITGRKRIEDELRANRDRLEFLISSTPAVIYTCKLYGDYANTFVSQNVTAQFGYVPEEIMKDSRFWVNHVHSEDRQLVLDSMNSLIKEGHYIHEYRLQHKDGTYRRIRDEMKLIRNESGNPMEAIGYMIDITQPDLMDGGRRKHGLSVWKRAERLEDAVEYRTRELIESEARYRDLVENIPDRVFAKDRNSVYVSCNKQYAYDFNIKSDEIRGKTDYDFYPRELADQYRAVDKRVIGSGRAEELEERYVARGQEFTVATIKTPLRDSAGNVSGVLGIFRDITERKRMEKMRDEFVADVTDELIIPLTSMKGYVDLMLSEHESVPQDFMERLEVVKRNTDRLINLTGQLLDLRRLMVARFFLHFESMDLRESIRDAVRETQPFVNKKKLALNVNLPDRPLMVRGDQTRLKEAIIALLSNATKFTAEEGKISLSAGETDTMVDVQISDTGIGIRSEDLKRVFEPFPAIQHADYVKGTGLALSLTKGLIEAHGGKIWVESAGEGEGATFTLTLPKAKQKQTDPLSLHL